MVDPNMLKAMGDEADRPEDSPVDPALVEVQRRIAEGFGPLYVARVPGPSETTKRDIDLYRDVALLQMYGEGNVIECAVPQHMTVPHWPENEQVLVMVRETAPHQPAD